MRVGLMRHFPVKEPMPSGWLTARCIDEWLLRYNEADVIPMPLETCTHEWHRCLSSDMKRAFLTAQAAHAGEIETTPLLREPPIQPLTTNSLRAPFWAWRWMLRLAWSLGHPSQEPVRREFEQRVIAVADLLESESSNILVVSHAGMMLYLRKELLRRGFIGPRFSVAEHAKLYVFTSRAS